MSDPEFPGWFNRHHEAQHERFDELARDFATIKQTLATGFDYLDRRLHLLLKATERLIEMSSTLAEQLAAAQADTNAKLDSIGTDVTEISADVDSLLAGMNTGDAVTQAMVDAAVGIQTRVTALKDALDAVNAKVPPTSP